MIEIFKDFDAYWSISYFSHSHQQHVNIHFLIPSLILNLILKYLLIRWARMALVLKVPFFGLHIS